MTPHFYKPIRKQLIPGLVIAGFVLVCWIGVELAIIVSSPIDWLYLSIGFVMGLFLMVVLTAPLFIKMEVGSDYQKMYYLGWCYKTIRAEDVTSLVYGNIYANGPVRMSIGKGIYYRVKGKFWTNRYSMGEAYYGKEAIADLRRALESKMAPDQKSPEPTKDDDAAVSASKTRIRKGAVIMVLGMALFFGGMIAFGFIYGFATKPVAWQGGVLFIPLLVMMYGMGYLFGGNKGGWTTVGCFALVLLIAGVKGYSARQSAAVPTVASSTVATVSDISAIHTLEDYDSYLTFTCSQYASTSDRALFASCAYTMVLNDEMSTGTLKSFAEQEQLAVDERDALVLSTDQLITDLSQGLTQLESQYSTDLAITMLADEREYANRSLSYPVVDAMEKLTNSKFGPCLGTLVCQSQ